LKLYKSALAVVALLASGLVATQPADAVPPAAQRTTATCSFKVPAKLSLRSAYTSYDRVPLGSDCPSTMVGADWTATWRNGQNLTISCHYGTCPGPSLKSTTPAGRVTWVGAPWGGVDENGNKVADLLPAYSDIRFASSASVNAGRKGTKTAFLTTVWYFSPKKNTYVRWAGWRLLLQYQEIGTTTWKGLAYVTTNASGQAAYTYYPGRTRRYRLYVPATTSVWDYYTPTISR